MAHILHRDPRPPSERVPGIPAKVEKVILQCLEKDAARRPASAAELASLLGAGAPRARPRSRACRARGGCSPRQSPVSPPSRWRWSSGSRSDHRHRPCRDLRPPPERGRPPRRCSHRRRRRPRRRRRLRPWSRASRRRRRRAPRGPTRPSRPRLPRPRNRGQPAFLGVRGPSRRRAASISAPATDRSSGMIAPRR